MIRTLVYQSGISEGQAIELGQLPASLENEGSLVWVDCVDHSESELEQLASRFHLHSLVVEDLRAGEQRTKFDQYADHFHVAVHDCAYDGELRSREIDIVFGTGWLITVRQPTPESMDDFPLESARGRFESLRARDDTGDLGSLLWALLDVVVDRYFLVTDAVDEQLDELEAVVLDDTVDPLQGGRPRDLFALGKALLRFRRAALPLREVVGTVLRHEAGPLGDASLTHFQDLYDHVLRVADLVESQRDIITGLREAQLAVISNKMGYVQQQIAAWGAILIVATLVTGVFGMNFRDAPDLSWEKGFAAVGVVIGLACFPLYLFFRRKRWL